MVTRSGVVTRAEVGRVHECVKMCYNGYTTDGYCSEFCTVFVPLPSRKPAGNC